MYGGLFIILITSLSTVISDDYFIHVTPPQDKLPLSITLDPNQTIDTMTLLNITVNATHNFNTSNLFTISTEFERMFEYYPLAHVVKLNLKNFHVIKHKNMFIVYCKFETEVDEDTHWEVLWNPTEGDDTELPIQSFFIESNIPTKMEFLCKELYSSDCSRLKENDMVILTCNVKTGMPDIKAYLTLPFQSNSEYLTKNDRLVKAKVKLTNSLRNVPIICGSPGVEINKTLKFDFDIANSQNISETDFLTIFIIVTIFSVIVIMCLVIGIYLVLIKPSKERSKEKVQYFVDNAQETNKPGLGKLIGGGGSKKMSKMSRLSRASSRGSRKSSAKFRKSESLDT